MCLFLQVATAAVLIGSISGERVDLTRALERAGGSGWNYAGQGNYWPVTHPICGGKRQSPINIDTSQVFNIYSGTLDFRKYSGPESGVVENKGATLQFTPDGTDDQKIPGIIDRNGSLGNDNYKLLQFHFHWGSENDRGSETTVDGQSFPMELHIVHIKKKYWPNDVATALTKADGLAVVGIMFHVAGTESSNPEAKFGPLQPLVDAAKELKDNPSKVIDTDLHIKQFLNKVGPGYYTYDGSLTTPPCSEVVSWYVMAGSIGISQEQLDAFRGMTYGEGFGKGSPMVDNYRPPQPLNNRIVKRHCHGPM